MASTKKSSGPRELIKPNEGDARYQRRDADGKFGDADKVSRSQAADKATKAKSTAPRGQGDKGDHKPAAKKSK